MPRRIADYPDAFAGWNFVSSIGSYISGFGTLVFFFGIAYAFMLVAPNLFCSPLQSANADGLRDDHLTENMRLSALRPDEMLFD